MKLVRKTLLGLTALAVVMGLASCKMGAGEGDTKGNKWDLTMTIDATETASRPLAADKVFRRYWKQFSTSEKVAEITTTVTIDPTKIVYPTTSTSACVVGLIFDLNKNAEDNNKVDFNLIGVNPKTGKFYVERYTKISKQTDESYDGTATESDLAQAAGTTAINLETVAKSGAWCTLTSSMYKTDADTGILTIPVKISQTNKKYTVYLNNVKVAEYNASTSTNVDTIKNVEYAVGGIACYGNAGKGVKIVANYTTDKSTVTGKLEAEEIEE